MRLATNNAGMSRLAVMRDENAILAMLDTTEYKHLHADWRMPTEWVGMPGVVVHTLDDVVRGYLAITLDPPPVAWVRVLGVKRHDRPSTVRQMLAMAIDQLQQTAATMICCLSVSDWVNELMAELGFFTTNTLQTYIKKDQLIPAVNNDNRITIRPVEQKDFSTVIAIEKRAFPDPMWWHSAEQIQRGKRFSCCFDVAEIDGNVVGFQYSTGSQGAYVHLVRIAVDPAVQGQGIGCALLADAFATYYRLGVSSVSLNSPSDKVAAHHLYAKFGFEPVGQPYPVWSLTL